MVLPREGLKDENGEPLKYDRIYYVGEYEFYIPRDENGKFKKFDSLGDNYDETLKAMRGLIPTHVVFNGKVGALTGDNAMKANATRKTELLIRINATAWQG